MNKIKALIVDDESAARDVLENLIVRGSNSIEIVGKCANVTEAVDKIKELTPAVVFLDVQMPNYAGYEIVDFFDEINFEIIFVTAYDQYAIKAFELSAVDYLVKPINRQRLNEAIQKLEVRVDQKGAIKNYELLRDTMKGKELGKIVISELGNKRIIQLSEIIAIEGKGAYSWLFLQDKKSLLVSKNLKHFESVLPENDVFFRSHKSWIINLDLIQEVNKGKGEILLSESVTARLSKYRLTEFYEATKAVNL